MTWPLGMVEPENSSDWFSPRSSQINLNEGFDSVSTGGKLETKQQNNI